MGVCLRMNTNRIEVFGSDEEGFIEVLDHVCGLFKGVKYGFIHADALKSAYDHDMMLGHRLHWFNLLQNIHFISCASLLRTKRWMDGIRYGTKEGNYILTASSLRGLIESTADSYQVMQYVGKSLEVYFTEIYMTLRGKIIEKDGVKVLPDSDPFDLIVDHFIFARKISDKQLERRTHGMDEKLKKRFKYVNQAKEPWKYIKILEEQGFGNMSRVYQEACEVVHPAEASVMLFLDENADHTFNLNGSDDFAAIQKFVNKYKKQLEGLLSPSITPSLLALSVLSKFPLNDHFFTSIVPSVLKTNKIARSINLENVPAWVSAKKVIEQKLIALKSQA